MFWIHFYDHKLSRLSKRAMVFELKKLKIMALLLLVGMKFSTFEIKNMSKIASSLLISVNENNNVSTSKCY